MRLRLTLIITLLSSTLFAGDNISSKAKGNFSAVGRDGITCYSTDGGASWLVGTSNTPKYINGIATDSYGNFWAVGSNGVVLKSEDYGASYEVVHTLTEETFNAIDIDKEGNIVIVGSDGEIYASYDLGKTFQSVGPDTDINLLDLNIDNPDLWVAVGIRGMVFTSKDSGKTWIAREKVFGSSQFNAITYTANGTYVIAGVRGALFTSKDGQTWNPQVFAEGFKGVIEDLASDKKGNIYAAGWNGVVFHSNDEAVTWTLVETGNSERLTALTISDGQIVMVGFSSTIVSNTGSNKETRWVVHDQLSRSHLMEVAPNHLPDLTIELKRTADCKVEVTVSNKGPGRLTDKPYRDESVGISISSKNKNVYSISLKDLDPGEKLKNTNGKVQHTVDLKISTQLKATWGLGINGIVKDQNMSNNSTSTGECPLK